MNCQYCGAELKEHELFCNNCGQAVTNADASTNITSFWQGENSKKIKAIIAQIASLEGKCEYVNNSLFLGRKIKSKGIFFRVMLSLFFLFVGTLSYGIYAMYMQENENASKYIIAASIPLILHIVVLTFIRIIDKKGPIGLLYPLIPVFGYYYLLFSALCGIGRMFVPLCQSEKTAVKDLKSDVLDLKILKKEEKDLKTGLSLIDKNMLNNPSLSHLKKDIVVEKKRINKWKIWTIIFPIVQIAVFVLSFYYSATIQSFVNNLLEEVV